MHIWSKVHVIHHIVKTRFRLISGMSLDLWYDLNAIDWISIHIVLCQNWLHFSSLYQRLITNYSWFKATRQRISGNHNSWNWGILFNYFRFMNISQSLKLIIWILTSNIWLLVRNILIFIRLWFFSFCSIFILSGSISAKISSYSPSVSRHCECLS